MDLGSHRAWWRVARGTVLRQEGTMGRVARSLGIGFVAAVAVFLVGACSAGGGGGGGGVDSRLERYGGVGYSIEKPKGWTVHPAGDCDTLALLARDPQQPLRQIYYFSSIGKIYTTAAQKALDEWYVAHGGYPPPWIDAPVVEPFTPEGFLAHWPEIARMQGATLFMAQFPRLEGLRLVATRSRPTMLPGLAGSATAEARGAFLSGGAVGEGMFLATTLPPGGPPLGLCTSPPSGPSGCTGYGFLVCGVTAPREEFAGTVDLLVASLNTFTVTQAYVQECLAKASLQFNAVAKAGQTLGEASDAIWDGWVARSHSEDVTFEQYHDAFMDVERVYDPASGTVYEVPAGWYAADYDPNRGSFQLGGLQLLPGEAAYWELWNKAPLGQGSIH
jgi:hypothetical protein